MATVPKQQRVIAAKVLLGAGLGILLVGAAVAYYYWRRTAKHSESDDSVNDTSIRNGQNQKTKRRRRRRRDRKFNSLSALGSGSNLSKNGAPLGEPKNSAPISQGPSSNSSNTSWTNASLGGSTSGSNLPTAKSSPSANPVKSPGDVVLVPLPPADASPVNSKKQA